MGKLTLGQKADRALKLLLGLRNPRIAAALMSHGFTDKDLQEGWTLLRALGTSVLDGDAAPASLDTASLQLLDQWENKWFPIAKAALQRHAPAAHTWFFRNLSQTEGPAVIVSVGTFVDRFDKLSAKASNGGPPSGGKAAQDKLVERGLTKEVLDEARSLIKKLGGFSGPLPDLPDLEEEEKKLAAAEEALWAWYLEWSSIIRSTITQRALLRQLGFLKTTAKGEEVLIDDASEEPTTPGDTVAEPAGAAGKEPAPAKKAKVPA
ncbi:MAG: hypothetical protein U0441_16850 [Polyangiaceae bacterium]